MTTALHAEPLTRDAFAPFGQVIEIAGAQHHPINSGTTERFHDLAEVDVIGEGARAIISIARAKPRALPLTLTMVERHPLGSQAFHPLSPRPFLVVVAPNQDNRPGTPRAFLTAPGQGVNYFRGTWHGVLTALDEPADFLIVDRGGPGNNLEEFHFSDPYVIVG